MGGGKFRKKQKESKMKTFLVILSLIVIGVICVTASKGCRNASDVAQKTHENDSLKQRLKSIEVEGEARYKQDSGLIHNITLDLDTTKKALAEVRQKYDARGRQILSTNKDLHAALIIHDTPTVYKTAEYLSFQIDSIAQEKWKVDRELDRQLVLNEQLRIADSVALANCRSDLKNTRSAGSALVANLEVQHQQDAMALKKAKKGRWFDRVIGAGIAEGVRGIINIFKK